MDRKRSQDDRFSNCTTTDVDVKAAEKAIGQPLIEKFEASKAKALTKTAPEKKGKKAKAAAK